MKHHPFTEIWPLLTGKAFEQLKTDIRVNGLKMPVLVYKEMILDGRNRQRACAETGVEIRYAAANVKDDDDALSLVVSLNQYRRHLSKARLAFAAEKLATLRNGSNQFGSINEGRSMDLPSIKSKSLQDAALEIGVSHSSVKRARAIRTYGTEQDVDDVVNDRVGLQTKSAQVRKNATRRSKTARRSSNGDDRVYKFVKAPPIPKLTQEQVDPEFKGTDVEFTDKYGHVQTMSAEKYATMRFGEWSSIMKTLAKWHRELPPISRPVDHNWLRSPNPYDLIKLRQAMQYLRPIFAEAEALLARAELAAPQQSPNQPTAGLPPTG